MQFIDLQKQYQVLKNDIDSSISNVLNKSNYILGEDVTCLENELAEYVGVKHCITCANGTDALTLALKTFNLSEKDAIFVPTFTFFASAETISQNGNPIFFVDVDEKTFNISIPSLEKTIEKVKKEGKYNPKCVVAVDLFGQCANYTKLKEICKKYDLLLLEDGAQGFGGSIDGKMACSFGDIATTSFFPAKPLGCYGDGGAIFTNNDDYATLLKSLRFHGKGSDKYDNVRLGFNSRLDTLQAAILRIKLKAFSDYELANRQAIAKKYDALLKNIVNIPYLPEGFLSSYAQYTLILNSEEERKSLQAYLKEKNIPSMIYYPKCMHEQTVYNDYKFNLDDLKNGENLAKKVLSIPMHPYLEDKDIEFIAENVKEGLKNAR